MTLELEPLLWHTPVPGVEHGGPLLFRDLGPAGNARVVARFPGRALWLLLPAGAEAGPLLPYEAGMRLLWESDY